MNRRTKAFRKAKRKVGQEEKRKMGQQFQVYGGRVSVWRRFKDCFLKIMAYSIDYLVSNNAICKKKKKNTGRFN